MFGKILSMLTGGFLGQVNDLVKTTAGDATQREGDNQAQQVQTQTEQQTEFTSGNKQGFLGQLADFLNRLPRFFMTMGTLALMVWAPINPQGFAVAMQAMGLIPSWLSAVFLQEVIFYFGDRITQVWNGSFKGPSAADVKDTLASIASLQQMHQETQQQVSDLADQHGRLLGQLTALTSAAPAEAGSAYTAEMKDTSVPLSNQAILEWNRRRNIGLPTS